VTVFSFRHTRARFFKSYVAPLANSKILSSLISQQETSKYQLLTQQKGGYKAGVENGSAAYGETTR
jgi:hypothetical protein